MKEHETMKVNANKIYTSFIYTLSLAFTVWYNASLYTTILLSVCGTPRGIECI
jgi:hypothetical protein